MQGIIHPIIARLIWSNRRDSLSPYRFCNQLSAAQNYSCTESMPLQTRLYILDFAGGGAVHLLGINLLTFVKCECTVARG